MRGEDTHDDRLSLSHLSQEEELRFSAPVPQIDGYQILEKLGEAGQGQVWRAVQLSTGRQVALKVPRIGLLSSKKTLVRFEREVEIAAQLRHPHIARIYDSGVHRGLYYYVMDLVEGKHLDQYVKDNTLSLRQIIELMKVVCEAVQHAHQNGVIHRDLKPSNILVTEGGHPCIIDFGLAKSIQASEAATVVSLDGEAAGTPAFMSPEQAGGHAEQIDTRTDVYSLGTILFMLLTGQNPHDLSGSHFDVLHRIATEEVRRPRILAPGIDRDLEALLLKALEQNPDHRYASVSGMAEDIDHYLTGLPLTATPRSRLRRLDSFVRRHRVGVLLGSSVCALALAAITILAVSTVVVRQEKQRTQHALERERQALGQEAQAKEEALRQRDLAYQNLYVAQIRLAPQYWEAGQIWRLEEMLEDYNPARGVPDLRGWEWYYLLSLCHNERMTLQGHTIGVVCVAWSPDGRFAASADKSGIVRVWETASGQECRVLRGHTGSVSNVMWSPDGKQLASAGSDSTARIWEVATGCEVLQFSGHSDSVGAIAWSPDGNELATGGDDCTVRLWSLLTGVENLLFKGHTSRVQSLAWRSDGRYVASGDGQGWLRIWEARTGKEIQTLRPLNHDLWSVAWSPDSTCIASTGYGHPLIVWDVASGQRRQTMPLTAGGTSITWSRDGHVIATATLSQLIQLFDVESGRRVATLRGHAGAVNSVSFDPNGRLLLSAGDDGTVKIWDLNEPQSVTVLPHPHAASVAWNPRGEILASAGGGVVKLWDMTTSRECAAWNTPLFYESEDNPEISMAWSPEDSRIVIGRWGGPGEEIGVWDSDTGAQVFRLSEGSNPAWSPDGRHLAISVGPVVEVWDLHRKRVAYSLAGHKGPVYSLSWSPLGDRLATGELGTVRIWDSETHELLHTLERNGNWVGTLSWHPDGKRLASGGWSHEFKIWDTHLGRELATFAGHTGAIHCVRWNLTGERIASGSSDNTVKVWDIATGRELLTLQGHTDIVRSVAWSPDDRRLATASQDGTVRIWDATKGYEMTVGSSRMPNLDRLAAGLPPQTDGIRSPDEGEQRATKPSPAHGSDVGPLRTVRLRWKPAPDAIACRVHFGEDPDTLVLLGNVAAGQGLDTGVLDKCKWYCWKVDTITNDGSIVNGNLWSFSTGNLVGWWKFDELEGDMTIDSSGFDHRGKLTGRPQWQPGRFGGALLFDGQDDEVCVQGAESWDFRNEVTLACWIKVDSFARAWQPAITRAHNDSWRLIRNADQRSMEFACAGVDVPGTRWGNVLGTKVVDDGQWHHVVGLYDGTRLCLYVDGALDASVAGSGQMNFSSDPVLIGATARDPQNRWNGLIDDVRIYSFALTMEEVKAICRGNGPGPLPRPMWAEKQTKE